MGNESQRKSLPWTVDETAARVRRRKEKLPPQAAVSALAISLWKAKKDLSSCPITSEKKQIFTWRGGFSNFQILNFGGKENGHRREVRGVRQIRCLGASHSAQASCQITPQRCQRNLANSPRKCTIQRKGYCNERKRNNVWCHIWELMD